jgi:protein translocase SecG subunit
MSLIIGFLTFILVMNCLFLMLLILIQLPKKEAGAGIAFGGAATDALFGAGSGNALTKMTKYSASIFVGMSVLLSVLNMQAAKQGTRRLEEEISKQAQSVPRLAPTLPTNAIAQPPAAAGATSATLQTVPASATTSTSTTAQTVVRPTTNLLISVSTNQVPSTPAPAAAPATPTPAPAK